MARLLSEWHFQVPNPSEIRYSRTLIANEPADFNLMTKHKSARVKTRVPPELRAMPAKSEAQSAAHHLPSASAIREAIESIVVAFILAFLFRTFEAEAFVIPTGSMAPTLMGRHKTCCVPSAATPTRSARAKKWSKRVRPGGGR